MIRSTEKAIQDAKTLLETTVSDAVYHATLDALLELRLQEFDPDYIEQMREIDAKGSHRRRYV